MSVDTDEFFIPSLLNLNLKFFSGYQQMRKYRRRGIPLVGTILPIGAEIVFAAGAAPIFPLRIGKFEAEKLMRGTRLATNILGSSVVGRGARMLDPMTIINTFLKEYAANLSGYETQADDLAFPPEACFATRLAYGSSLPFKDFIKLFLAWGTRCGWFSQFYQLTNDSIPIALTDLPNSTSPHAKEYMYEGLLNLIKKLEDLTGNKVTDEKLREKIILANEVRASFKELLSYLKTPDRIPLSSYAYMQSLATLNICLVDFLSALKFFTKNFTRLMKELRTRKPKDFTGIPKLLLVPVFSGSEPELPQMVHDLGGLLIQADWWGYGLLDEVATQGDMVRNYGDYLIRTHMGWKDNKTISESWLQIAKEFKVDGIIFNRLIGCTSVTSADRFFRDRVQDSGIPLIDVNFNRIGENIAQIKNKLASFMEVVKKT